jgi:deoxyadenosine/deoxycytidine kinase
MQIVQIIGSPCVGKSSFIRALKEKVADWSYYDIAAHTQETDTFLSVENNILKSIVNENVDAVIESACGFNDLKGKVIRLKVDHEIWLSRIKERHPNVENIDDLLDYYSMLETQAVKADETFDISDEAKVDLIVSYIANKYLSITSKTEFN